MPDVLVRDLEVVTIERLKTLARKSNRSLQAEAKIALSDHAERRTAHLRSLALARKVKASLGHGLQPDSVELLREDRNR
ncbi:MAG: TraY domain-containing protein [Pyrinomonadaceae bacterium]